MRSSNFYRVLLRLYPVDFQKQFSEEMVYVFEQRAGEHSTYRNSAVIAFCLTEFFSLLKGAYSMWLAKLVPIDRKTLHSGRETSTGSSSTVNQIKEQRDAALRAMIAAIAKHDFTNARRYSEEEIRLKRTLKELEATVPAGQSRTA